MPPNDVSREMGAHAVGGGAVWTSIEPFELSTSIFPPTSESHTGPNDVRTLAPPLMTEPLTAPFEFSTVRSPPMRSASTAPKLDFRNAAPSTSVADTGAFCARILTPFLTLDAATLANEPRRSAEPSIPDTVIAPFEHVTVASPPIAESCTPPNEDRTVAEPLPP